MLRRSLACLVSVSSFVLVPVASAQEDVGDLPADSAGDAASGAAGAEAPATAPVASPEDKGNVEKTPEAKNGRHGLLGPVRLGFDAALGFPHPLTYGLAAMWNDTVSGGISFGDFEAKSSGATVGISNWDLRARWHPFGGSYFVGAAYGTQTINAELESDISVGTATQKTKLKLEVETNYLTPHMGWFAMWDSGFTLGFDFGYQLALSSKTKDLEVDFGGGTDPSGSDEFKKKEDDIKKAAEAFGKTSVPYLTLLRLGWMF